VTTLWPRAKAYARHILQQVGTMTIGPLFVSGLGQAGRRALAQLQPALPLTGLRVAIVAHAYYPELLSEVLFCRSQLPGEPPLHVTVPPEKEMQAREALSGVNGVTIHVCENRGRDIWPFISLLNAGIFDGHDAVLKLHTKRSPHLLDGEVRRKLLFLMLCGQERAVARTLASFVDPAVGMAGWAYCWRYAPPYWMANRARAEDIGQRMGAPEAALHLGFFEGSMFWFRPKALAHLRALGLRTEDFEPESGQTDGTLHHAIERCFTMSAWSGGYQVRDLKGALLQPSD
jgi:lipopolysaccharide biosynthesis protein